LLPAGAIAGWALHPLENAALARRTPIAVIASANRQAPVRLLTQGEPQAHPGS